MAQVVGLDIGTSAVRAAELEFGSGAPVLVAFGQVGLPPGAIVDGEVQDLSAVSDAIMRLWQNGKFQSKSVVVGIAGLRAITREVDLPWVPDEDVDSAVRFQSEEVIPFPPDKTILSAQVLSDNVGPDGAKTRRVLVAAAHRDLVDGVVAAAENAGLIVEGVDLVSSALVRALGDPSVAAERPEAIVSIGAGLTVVVVHQGGRPQFVRTIGTGGNAATAAVASALDLPLVDAEGIKRRLGEVHSHRCNRQRARCSRPSPSSWERSATPCSTSPRFPGAPPSPRVLLTGGGARLRGLVKELRAQVRIPVEHVSPLARLDLSKIDLDPEQAASIEPVLATPIGLALPGAESLGQEVQSGSARDHPTCLRARRGPQGVRGGRCGRAPARRSERLALPPGPQRPERRQQPPHRCRRPQRADPEVRQGRRHQQRAPGGHRARSTAAGGTAVDWSAVVSQLGGRIPAGSEHQHLQRHRRHRRGRSWDHEHGDGGKLDGRRIGPGCRGDRLADGGTGRQLPELCALRSRGAVDRQPDRVADVQSARRERAWQTPRPGPTPP